VSIASGEWPMSVIKEAKQRVEKFHLKCGEILRLGLSIEGSLEFVIAKYLTSNINKECIIRDEILINVGFERKISLFKKICEAEDIDGRKLKEAVKVITFVKDLRNKVAHDGAHMNASSSHIQLQTRRSILTKEALTDLNDSTVEEVREKEQLAIRGIFEIYAILMDKDKVPKIKMFGLTDRKS
jgi:hypothetical protein